ncbi:S66 peptidase family protein [Chryseolinea lacunae]|uniref:LD-carboxypeptidase n=1 Tax=Chryseolinea lacunae TaxID=2801331 RepID=A0ABS1KSW0_9BACT|nr:LD-carboxypeptidase [Chryseolinea lacunae]MBL0741787.1 LD-carboxypeptidase [Chryseolinea lacunae]
MMIRPPFLAPGATVAIAATGRKVVPTQMEEAKKILTAWGLNVRFAPHLFSDGHTYLAGTDQERLEDFQNLVNDKTIHAIICARGGYGTTRIVDAFNFDALVQNPKWIVGFSDVTSLHLKLFAQGIESIHGTMPVLFGQDDAGPSLESLRNVLFGESWIVEALPDTDNQSGVVTAPIIGGNLSLVADAMGTPSEPDTSGKILVIEEICEHKYKLDRLLTQLKRAGKLERLAGLVVGHMTDIEDSESFSERVQEIVLNKVKGHDYPVAFGLPIGHENPNLAWRHGSTVRLKVDARGCRIEMLNAV